MHLSHDQIDWIIGGLLFLGLVVIIQPLLLTILHSKFHAEVDTPNGQLEIRSFFQIPYVTWFLIHHGIAILAILAIVGLGISGVINSATVSGLLGGLFGYVLGSASGHAASASNFLHGKPAGDSETTKQTK